MFSPLRLIGKTIKDERATKVLLMKQWKITINVLITFIFCLVIIGLILYGLTSHPLLESLTSMPSEVLTPIFDANAEELFVAIAPLADDLNSGITIKQNKVASDFVDTSPSPRYVSFLVLNNTQEPVAFDNIGFEIQVFEYNARKFSWETVILPYTPEKRQKILPPNLTKLDFQVLNIWELFDRDLVNVKSDNIRIFISGTGEVTKSVYGAYIDVTLPK